MKNSFVLILLVSVLFVTLNCGNWWDLMSSDGKTMIIRGDKEIKNETLVLAPGTTVVFKEQWTKTIQGDSWGGYSTLTIGEGATLIAKGTPDEPIIFKNGGIYFNGTTNNILEYCVLSNCSLEIYRNVKILNSKILNADILIYSKKSSLFFSEFNQSMIYSSEGSVVTIKYNYISDIERSGMGNAIAFSGISIVEYNNIINSDGYALLYNSISASNYFLAKYNYIADCNGMIGVDTNGSQCKNVIFSNYYRTQPVPNAGCGW